MSKRSRRKIKWFYDSKCNHICEKNFQKWCKKYKGKQMKAEDFEPPNYNDLSNKLKGTD